MEYTQSLYEKKLCTYPRTDSQYLSDDMEGTIGEVTYGMDPNLFVSKYELYLPDEDELRKLIEDTLSDDNNVG